MRFGICCGPGSFVPQTQQQTQQDQSASIGRMMDVLHDAGADYVEFAVGAVVGSEEAFEKLCAALEPYPLMVEVFNSFIPAQHRITGPEVRFEELLAYCDLALRRCHALGAAVVVLGSGAARRVPDGFDPAQAEAQFVEFGRALGPLADQAGIDIAIEPLNKREDNLVNSVEHGAKLVDAIGHPRIQLLADLYHMFEDGESLFSIAAAGPRLKHVHVADLGRLAPGYASGGEANFAGFFRALKAAGYHGRCSFEGKFNDIAVQSKPVIRLLRQRWEQA